VPRRDEFSRCIGAELKVQTGYPGRTAAVGSVPFIDRRWPGRTRQCDASSAERGAADRGREAGTYRDPTADRRPSGAGVF
jgi:hypothetical protein